MIQDWKTTKVAQTGKAGKKFDYTIKNPVDQEVVFGVDMGTPRIVGESQWKDMHYNLYLSDASGNSIFGPVDVSTQYGYGQ